MLGGTLALLTRLLTRLPMLFESGVWLRVIMVTYLVREVKQQRQVTKGQTDQVDTEGQTPKEL